jgi:hypothetical protein
VIDQVFGPVSCHGDGNPAGGVAHRGSVLCAGRVNRENRHLPPHPAYLQSGKQDGRPKDIINYSEVTTPQSARETAAAGAAVPGPEAAPWAGR